MKANEHNVKNGYCGYSRNSAFIIIVQYNNEGMPSITKGMVVANNSLPPVIKPHTALYTKHPWVRDIGIQRFSSLKKGGKTYAE